MRVVVDCGNGAVVPVGAHRVLRELGAAVEVFNAAPDGTNINDAVRLDLPAGAAAGGARRPAPTPGSRSTATPTA